MATSYLEQEKKLENLTSKKPTKSFLETPVEFTCQVCKEIVTNPVMHGPCGDIFCEECVNELVFCPSCKTKCKSSDFGPVPKALIRQIGKLKVKCDVCGETMSLADFETHDKKCSFLCPFKCGENAAVATTTISKEEALRKADELLKSQPDLRTATEFGWNEEGAGSELLMLSELLKANAIPLKTLNLGGCNIGDEGAIMISESLKTNTTLTTLDLGVNNIGDEGAIMISESLKINTTLTTLRLWSDEIEVK